MTAGRPAPDSGQRETCECGHPVTEHGYLDACWLCNCVALRPAAPAGCGECTPDGNGPCVAGCRIDLRDLRARLDALDAAPTDPYEHVSWLALRQETVPALTAALGAVLDLADGWDADHPVGIIRAEVVDRIRAAVAEALGGAS